MQSIHTPTCRTTCRPTCQVVSCVAKLADTFTVHFDGWWSVGHKLKYFNLCGRGVGY